MGVNSYDGPVAVDTIDTTTFANYFGFGVSSGAVSGPQIGVVNVNPSAGAGVAANLGSIAIRYDAGNCQIWQKTTGAATGWVQTGSLSGAVSLTGIDTTATANFDWDLADNSATALSFDSAGDDGILAISTLEGSERVTFGGAGGTMHLDAAELILGTGSDIVMTPDGTDVLITGTGRFNFEDDIVLGFGSDNDALMAYISGSNIVGLVTAPVSGAAALAASSGLTLATGARTVTNAAVGTGSGPIILQSGTTDVTDAGGTAGASGTVTIGSGNASSTTGAGSGASGAVSFGSGTSADAATGTVTISSGNAGTNSGDIILTTGTAGATRGVLDVNVATVDLATQATDFAVIDNSASGLRVVQGSTIYLAVATTNSSEEVRVAVPTPSASTTAPCVRMDGAHQAGNLRMELVEPFAQRPQLAAAVANADANKSFCLSGTNAASAGAVYFAGGGVQLSTAGAANDQMIVIPHTTANQSQWQTIVWDSEDQVVWRGGVRIADNANIRVEAGIRDSFPAPLTDGGSNNTLAFRFDTGASNNWFTLEETNNGGVTATDTGVAANVSGTNFRFVISVDSSRVARFYLNGALVRTTAALTATTALGKPYYAAEALAAAARQLVIHPMSGAKGYTA